MLVSYGFNLALCALIVWVFFFSPRSKDPDFIPPRSVPLMIFIGVLMILAGLSAVIMRIAGVKSSAYYPVVTITGHAAVAYGLVFVVLGLSLVVSAIRRRK